MVVWEGIGMVKNNRKSRLENSNLNFLHHFFASRRNELDACGFIEVCHFSLNAPMPLLTRQRHYKVDCTCPP